MKKWITLSGFFFIVLLITACSKDDHDLFADIHGVITNYETGEPIAGVTVLLSPGGKNQVTGIDGWYRFNAVEVQQYTITAQKSGYRTNRKTITPISGESSEANMTLQKN